MHFKAHVQYGDWKGTAAADDSGQLAIAKFLEALGLIEQGELILGIDFFSGENHGGKVEKPYVSALVFKCAPDADLPTALENCGRPIPVRSVRVDVSLEEFFGLFKRVSVMLCLPHNDIEGAEYREIEPGE